MKYIIKVINIIVCSGFVASGLSSCEVKVRSKPPKDQQMIQKFSYPKSTGFDVDYLMSNFWRISYNSAGAELAYKIVLPKTMKPTNLVPTPVPNMGITIIGDYQVIDKDAPYMEVQVVYEKASAQYPDIKSWLDAKLETLKGTKVEESQIEIAKEVGYDV